MLWQSSWLIDVYWGQVWTYSLDARDLWLNRVASQEYMIKISCVKYSIENNMITIPSARLKIEDRVVEDQKAPNWRLKRIIIISKILLLD